MKRSTDIDELIIKFSLQNAIKHDGKAQVGACLLYTSPSPRD